MAKRVLHQLADLLEHERDTLLAEWRVKVRALPAARDLDAPTLNDHIPRLVAELVAALRSGSDETIAEALADGSPPAHGLQRVKDAYDIEEVVAEYNILRGCIHELADRKGIDMRGKPFHVLNKVLDGAIGSAVQVFADQKALEVSQRREEYLAFVAHDLRTPLTAISLSARVLEMLLAPRESGMAQAAQMLKSLNRNVQHLETLVSKVIEEATNTDAEVGIKVERRTFDLWPMVEGLIRDLHPVAGLGTTRLTNGVPDDLVVHADAGLLKRIFQNLIANAITYTPRGDVLIGARSLGDGEAVECFVQDTGEGIPPERCLTVFDKHETDPAKPGGFGLGLTIVKAFVEAHQGSVTVESEVGVGTTFRFTLPGRPGSA